MMTFDEEFLFFRPYRLSRLRFQGQLLLKLKKWMLDNNIEVGMDKNCDELMR